MGHERKYEGVRPGSGSSIEIDFRYNEHRCKERLPLEPTPANLKRASLHRAAILAAIRDGSFDYATTFPKSKNAQRFSRQLRTVDGSTVAAFLDSWIKAKAPELKSSTLRGYEKVINRYWVPTLGKDLLADLRRPRIKEVCATFAVTNKTLANAQSVLRAALDDAVEDELLEANPLADWTYSRADEVREDDDIDPFTAAEQRAILSVLDGTARNQVQVAFWTGMRTSEQVALEWRDVDFAAGVIRVRRVLTQNSKAPEPPKTKAGRRDIKMLPPAREALEAQFKLTGHRSTVFLNPAYDEPWTGDQAIRKTMWRPALEQAKVRYRYPYQTRHTYASMLLSAGENPMWVAKQMGHSDWGEIRRRYGRFMPEAAPDAGERACRMFWADGQQMVNIGENVAS